MTDVDNKTEGKKVLAIADGSKTDAPQLLQQEEKEVKSLKLSYYMWLSRLFVFFAIVSLLVFLNQSLALFHLAPSVRVEPFLIINQNSTEEIIRNEAIENNMPSQNQLMEMFIKQYVTLRNVVINDPREMQSRLYPGGLVNFLSSPDVYEAFLPEVERILQYSLQSGLSREVEILAVKRQGGQKSPVWKVDFKTYEIYRAGKDSTTGALLMKTKYWTASVTAFFFKERMFMGRRLLNPMGFTVLRYSQTEVEL